MKSNQQPQTRKEYYTRHKREKLILDVIGMKMVNLYHDLKNKNMEEVINVVDEKFKEIINVFDVRGGAIKFMGNDENVEFDIWYFDKHENRKKYQSFEFDWN